MDAKQQFKAGFLLRCAEEGLSPPEIVARIKTALDMSYLPRMSLGTAIATGVLGGATIGGAAGLIGRDDILARKRPPNLKALQSAELTATYLQQTDEINRSRELLRRKQQRLTQNPPTNRHGI